MARLFGTDGVRGIANTDLTCEMAYRLGQAAVVFMGGTIVVGKDTRRSGDMLEAAVEAGIMSAGGTALSAGIIPTPGVALLVREMHADGGIVISASHNPPEYNGIKFFDALGYKLPDAKEDEIQEFVMMGGLEGVVCRMQDAGDKASMPYAAQVGQLMEIDGACDIYVSHVVEAIRAQGISFDGIHIALDTGHGASSLTSADAFMQLGAEVTVINDDFDGMDINVECGSTHLDPLHTLMDECGADIGIAHDGDADRVMLMASDKTVIDGDIVEAVIARDMKERGCLPYNTVVSTVMCNLGFVHAMRDAGISVVQTNVGDRYVLECMREHGYMIGGEQSGHMILLEHNSTGDGLMTACQFLAALVRSGKPVSELIKVMTRFPQTLIGVRVADKSALSGNVAIAEAIAQAEEAMGDTGRVLVRASGTEPLIRVMVEAASEDDARTHAEAIARIVEEQMV